MVDPEAELGLEERAKLESDVKDRGLSLVLFADWYSEDVMAQVCIAVVATPCGDASVCAPESGNPRCTHSQTCQHVDDASSALSGDFVSPCKTDPSCLVGFTVI